MNAIQVKFSEQGLVRPSAGGVVAGVCAGVGRRFGIDPWPTRALFILSLIVIPGSQILIYPLLWFLMPSESAVSHGGGHASGASSRDVPPYGIPPR